MNKWLRYPLVKFFLALMLVNLLCWWFNPYNRVPDAVSVPRNVESKRAWPKYVSAPKDPDKKLVVLIGNSQSYGEFEENPETIYPALLKQKLNNHSVVLENWSLRGIRTADIELLSAQAIAKGADMILFVLDMSNFDAPENINLDFPNTDINLLLSDAKVRELMEHSLLRKNYNIEHVLRKILQRYVPMASIRHPFYTELSDRIVNKHDEIFVFGNPVSREFNPQINDFKVMRDRLMHKKLNPNFKVKIEDTHFFTYLKTAVLFDYYLSKRLKGSQTKVMFVWQPLLTQQMSELEIKRITQFRKNMNKLNQKFAFKHKDLVNAVSASGMTTISHFNSKGHRAFADTLFQYLKHEF
jgi:lysophospholipase L1-like esterase